MARTNIRATFLEVILTEIPALYHGHGIDGRGAVFVDGHGGGDGYPAQGLL